MRGPARHGGGSSWSDHASTRRPGNGLVEGSVIRIVLTNGHRARDSEVELVHETPPCRLGTGNEPFQVHLGRRASVGGQLPRKLVHLTGDESGGPFPIGRGGPARSPMLGLSSPRRGETRAWAGCWVPRCWTMREALVTGASSSTWFSPRIKQPVTCGRNWGSLNWASYPAR